MCYPYLNDEGVVVRLKEKVYRGNGVVNYYFSPCLKYIEKEQKKILNNS